MVSDVRMRGFRDRVEVEAVVRLLDDRIASLAAETVALAEAGERVLSVDVVSEVNVPGFDRAAMDGYALRGSETFGAGSYNPLELTVAGEAFPGRPFPGSLQTGQAVRIMTGAPLADAARGVLADHVGQESGGQAPVPHAG